MTKESIRQHLEDVLASDAFRTSPRAQNFLQLVVERTLANRPEELRERLIGVELYGRTVNYDTSNDGIVRVEASKVRKRLSQYYREVENKPELMIELPLGSYVPAFRSLESVSHEPKPQPATVAEIEHEPTLPTAATSEKPHPEDLILQQAVQHRRTMLWLPIVAGVLGLLGMGVFAGRMWREHQASSSQIRTIAVLPLTEYSNSSSSGLEADSMTAELIADLGEISALHVISRTSSMTFKGSKETLPEIARHLGADAIVEGSVVVAGQQVHITANLIDARTDQPLWSRRFIRNADNTLNVEGEIAQAIADEIKVVLTPDERAHLVQARTVVPQARQYLAQARAAEDMSDLQNALEYSRKAVEADPNYAAGYAELAKIYGALAESGALHYQEAVPLAQSNVLKAIALDDRLAEAHAIRAVLDMSFTWDWPLVEQELNRAKELNPSLAEVRWANAFLLSRIGHSDAAIDELKYALQLDPVTFSGHQNAAYIYYFARRYDDAMDMVNEGLAMQHKPNGMASVTGSIDAEKGLYKEAIAQFQLLGEGAHTLGHMGNTYGRMGDAAAARQTIAKVEQMVAQYGVGHYEIALVYAGMGERDQAFAWLEKALKVRDKGMTYIKIDPCMDSLRSDPRFQELVRRVGLP